MDWLHFWRHSHFFIHSCFLILYFSTVYFQVSVMWLQGQSVTFSRFSFLTFHSSATATFTIYHSFSGGTKTVIVTPSSGVHQLKFSLLVWLLWYVFCLIFPHLSAFIPSRSTVCLCCCPPAVCVLLRLIIWSVFLYCLVWVPTVPPNLKPGTFFQQCGFVLDWLLRCWTGLNKSVLESFPGGAADCCLSVGSC